MTKKWIIKYWVDSLESPLESWFDDRNHEQIKSIAKEMALLERSGNTLRLPHSRSVGRGLFELRERSFGYRIYYAFASNGEIVLLQAGDKNTQQRDIKIAYKRLNKLTERQPA